VATRFKAVKARNGIFGVIGSNHTTNEENYYLQKFARQGLGTNNIDHHRTGDVSTLIDALSGTTGALATSTDLYERKAFLVIGADLAIEQPFVAFQIRANQRHHDSHVYVVTPNAVREDANAKKSVRKPKGEELGALEDFRSALAAEAELVIVFNDSVKGESVRKLVSFGQSLGIPVRYCALVDYSNSRGAIDMGLTPELLPGYQASNTPGMTVEEMRAIEHIDALWVVGANPLKSGPLKSQFAFVVVQDMFMTETAKRADVIFPAANAYEKNGTVTNVCGEVQKLKRAAATVGTKPDLEIIGLVAKEMGMAPLMGPWLPDTVYSEIRREVKGYNIAPAAIALGAPQTTPVNGRVGVESRPDLIHSANDTLFTSGTLGRYSKILNSVLEKRSTANPPMDREEYVKA
jgi:NADH-quinone oxidoreductase subunit G